MPPVSLLRQIQPDEIRCPEGTLVGDSACYCGIEAQTIEGRLNPDSLTAFCMGDYTECPSLRREREAEWAGEPTLSKQVRDAQGRRAESIASRRAAEERRNRSMELLHSQTEEGRKFRGRLRAVLDQRAVGLVPGER